MASLNSPALRRRLDAVTEVIRRRVEHRERMRDYAKAAANIRAALTEAGIDPVQNSGMREFGRAERAVAEWPDTPELQQSDAAFIAQDPKLAARQSLAAEAAERVGRFAGQPPPDRWTSMSPFDWYAWSLGARPGQPAVTGRKRLAPGAGRGPFMRVHERPTNGSRPSAGARSASPRRSAGGGRGPVRVCVAAAETIVTAAAYNNEPMAARRARPPVCKHFR